MGTIEMITPLLFGLLGGGGVTTIITAIISKKKKNKEDVAATLVKTTMEIEKLSTKRYMDLSQEFAEIKRVMTSLEKKLIAYKSYAETLKDLLKDNGIVFPDMRDV